MHWAAGVRFDHLVRLFGPLGASLPGGKLDLELFYSSTALSHTAPSVSSSLVRITVNIVASNAIIGIVAISFAITVCIWPLMQPRAHETVLRAPGWSRTLVLYELSAFPAYP